MTTSHKGQGSVAAVQSQFVHDGTEARPASNAPRKSPCDECAFTKGAAANLEPYNQLRGMVCALGPLPFGCHHNLDWHNSDRWTVAQQREALRTAGICQGWAASVRELKAKGVYSTPFQAIRQAVAKQALMAIELFVGAKNEREKKRMHGLLRRMLSFLAAKNVAHRKIPLLWG